MQVPGKSAKAGPVGFEEPGEADEGRSVAFLVTLGVLAAIVIGAGAWGYAQLPAATALSGPAAAAFPAQVLDATSKVVVDQLANASGRTLESIAMQVQPVAAPSQEEAPTVADSQAETVDYAAQLAALAEAEKAAAEQLAMSKEEARTAQEERKRAQAELASEEAAAAKEIDAAIAAAIAAAEAQSALDSIPTAAPVVTPDPSVVIDPNTATTAPGSTTPGSSAVVPAPSTQPDGAAGQVPGDGAPINTAGVLALVRKYFPADEVTNAMAVSRCESGHRNAVGAENGNGTRDYGIFQINDGGTLQAALRRIGETYSSITEARTKALDAELNVRMARVLWDSRGWQPWVCAAKVKVVSGLYERTPGPMYGKYDEAGQAG